MSGKAAAMSVWTLPLNLVSLVSDNFLMIILHILEHILNNCFSSMVSLEPRIFLCKICSSIRLNRDSRLLSEDDSKRSSNNTNKSNLYRISASINCTTNSKKFSILNYCKVFFCVITDVCMSSTRAILICLIT